MLSDPVDRVRRLCVCAYLIAACLYTTFGMVSGSAFPEKTKRLGVITELLSQYTSK